MGAVEPGVREPCAAAAAAAAGVPAAAAAAGAPAAAAAAVRPVHDQRMAGSFVQHVRPVVEPAGIRSRVSFSSLIHDWLGCWHVSASC